MAQLESVVGDNEEAVEILTALKGEIGDANAKVVGMEDQVAAMKDQYLRLNADFDNFRKRTLKEKELVPAPRVTSSRLFCLFLTTLISPKRT